MEARRITKIIWCLTASPLAFAAAELGCYIALGATFGEWQQNRIIATVALAFIVGASAAPVWCD